jgi:D-tyrosyl-tRNA(Tyr) deacylase
MIAVIQRVDNASVKVDNKTISQIQKGYLIYLGVVKEDDETDAKKLSEKILNLRIMADNNNRMNRSVIEEKGEVLVVSQFTLAANLKGGRRPDFFSAMEPQGANNLYTLFTGLLKDSGVPVKTGQFSAYMKIESINDGPVTFIINSKDL